MLLAALIAGAVAAEAPPPPVAPKPKEPVAWSITGENDSLARGSDRNYTSGLKVSMVAPVEDIPDWAKIAERYLFDSTEARPSLWGVAMGQSLFTPEDIAANPAPAKQHPYAGYLYLQVMLAAEENRDEDPRPAFLDTVELELGLIGPAALGRQSQQGIHEILGAPEPKGWDSQLHDELVFALTVERRWRAVHDQAIVALPFGLEADILPSLGATLGTLRTEARAGLSLRLGYGLDEDYGAPRVRPGLSGAGYFRPTGAFSWYVFAGVDLRAVARNVFLDGNTYRDSARVDKKTFVADAQIGLAVQVWDWQVVYTYVTRTEEFKTQGGRQDFGALSIGLRF
jgi:lipid A 3-O-deacylase